MQLGPHSAYIVASYAVVVAVALAMIVWVVADYRTQRRELADLERQGVTRRSTQGGQ